MKSQQPRQVKSCPQCGHDVFRVCKTWHGEERFYQRAPNAYGKENVGFDEEEYHYIECVDCGHEIADVDELYLQKAGQSHDNANR